MSEETQKIKEQAVDIIISPAEYIHYPKDLKEKIGPKVIPIGSCGTEEVSVFGII